MAGDFYLRIDDWAQSTNLFMKLSFNRVLSPGIPNSLLFGGQRTTYTTSTSETTPH